MATDYNADLIAGLYATQDVKKAEQISEEMADIGDEIFPRQIYEAYKRFKNTSSSHCFVSDISSFKSLDAGEILKAIAENTQKESDVLFALERLADIRYFEERIIQRVLMDFKASVSDGKIYDYEIDRYYNYIKKSGVNTLELENILINCFENDDLDISIRRNALKKLLFLNAKKYIAFYYSNYEILKNKKAEIVFVSEISTWRGGLIPAVHEKVLSQGSTRAKEILRGVQMKVEEDKQKKESKEHEEIREEFQTADVISEIAKLRSRINLVSTAHSKLGYPIFVLSEEIYQQTKPAKDKETLVGYSIVLRSLIGNFTKEITNFEVALERARELIPDIVEVNGSINKFHLMLLERGLSVDRDLYGLRNLNKIASQLAHPGDDVSELIELLKKEDLFNLFKNGNWPLLHRGFLIMYKNFLDKLLILVS